ncbi:tRNA threonylcarbamoyladenosine dehydratase [Dechloromonas sp. ZY10]|uniref:tRNA threonylcarbamoyladenosine dehydratase n=1 Tax=Dechloromonas aquae TaxID=2664436 RepID=UPI003528BC47
MSSLPGGDRRFGGVSRLYGETAAKKLENAHICIIGIGGVGSWCVEALARSKVGHLTLIDLDMVAESNTNRQIHALDDIYGLAKVEAMRRRIKLINPDCRVDCIEDFVTPENCSEFLSQPFSVVIDAIDQVKPKIALIIECRKQRLPLIVVGAAGGKLDPTRIRSSDLSQTIQDPLLAKIRSQLRRSHNFPRDPKKKFGIAAIFSDEAMQYPENKGACATERTSSGLNCAGFGSSVCVTSVFGMIAAAQAIKSITQAD